MNKRSICKTPIFISLGMLLSAALGFSSCNNTGTSPYSKDSDTGKIERHDTINRKLCFRRISGNQNRDTLAISMYIANNRIKGEMTDAVYEKDARRGQIAGRLNENSITATWTYMQEGMMDTLQLQFLLQNGRILMAPLVYNPKSGRQETDSSASPWISIPEAACPLSKD